MHPFAEANVHAAHAQLEKTIEALRAAVRCRTEQGSWALISRALGHAANAKAQLTDALTLEEMAVTTGEEDAAQ